MRAGEAALPASRGGDRFVSSESHAGSSLDLVHPSFTVLSGWSCSRCVSLPFPNQSSWYFVLRRTAARLNWFPIFWRPVNGLLI